VIASAGWGRGNESLLAKGVGEHAARKVGWLLFPFEKLKLPVMIVSPSMSITLLWAMACSASIASPGYLSPRISGSPFAFQRSLSRRSTVLTSASINPPIFSARPLSSFCSCAEAAHQNI